MKKRQFIGGKNIRLINGFKITIKNKNIIYIPLGSDWSGINDQIAIGSHYSMSIYLSFYKDMELMLINKEIRIEPESALLAWLKKKNIIIKRFDLKYEIVR